MKAGLVGLFVVLLLLLPQSGARAATTASAPKPLCPPFPKVQKRDPNAPTKRIVIFFDGTWNGDVDLSIQTNVHRLYSSVCARQIEPGNEGKILAWYDPGVGSDFRKLTGGAFGYGFSKNVRDGYEFLSRYFNPGDQIYVFGFSRGAFTARTFAAMVQQVGVLNRDAYFTKKGGGLDESDFRNDYEELFKTVKQVGQEESERCGEPFWTWNDIWWRKTSSGALAQLDEGRAEAVPGTPARLRTEIEVVGVWDTVAALGRTHGVPEPKYLVTISDLPAVRRAYQALAIDESRPNFSPIFWSPHSKQECKEAALPSRADWVRADTQVVDESWFAGAHSDVGGGYKTADSDNMARVSLAWMISKLRKDELIPQSEGTQTAPDSASVAARHIPDSSNIGVSLFAPGVDGVRDPQRGAQIHHSVCDRLAAATDRVEGSDITSIYGPCGLFEGTQLRSDLKVVGNVGPEAGNCERVSAKPQCPKRDGEGKPVLPPGKQK